MFEALKYLQLAWLIAARGRLKHSGEDFSKARAESLNELQEFVPVHNHATASSRATAQSGGTTHQLIAQSAFVKNSVKLKGGHLTVNDVNYIRIPKVANTSMSNAMLEKIYPALKETSLSETQINFLTDLNLQNEVRTPSVTFTIVRNPFARLVSVYRDLFEKPEHYIYRDYLFGILSPHLSFSDFVHSINRIPDRLKDQHFKPQKMFLKFYEQKKVEVKVFKLEEPAALNQFLGQYNMSLPHLNKSGESYDYQTYYNRVSVKKALEIYEGDVIRFGYQNEYKQLSESTRNSQKTVH